MNGYAQRAERIAQRVKTYHETTKDRKGEILDRINWIYRISIWLNSEEEIVSDSLILNSRYAGMLSNLTVFCLMLFVFSVD